MFAELQPNSHMLPSLTEPNIRPNSSAELRHLPNFGPSLMSMSKHCSSIYFRCQTTVLAFALSVTVMLLSTDLTSAPDDKIIGIKYCQKISEKVLPILLSTMHTKSITDTCTNTQKVSPILLVPIQQY